MARLLLITILFLSSGQAYAEWLLIGGDNEAGMALYVDPGTISRNGDQVTMWILYDFKTWQTKEAGDSFLSVKLRREYDCTKEHTWLLAVTNYWGPMGTGRRNEGYLDKDHWLAVTPDSMDHDLWEVACGKP